MRVDKVTTSQAAPAAPRPAPGAPGFGALLASTSSPNSIGPLESMGQPRTASAAQSAALATDIYAAAAQAEAADHEARRHGRAMLQALAALQLAILGGSEGEARSQLAHLAAQPTQADDPVLRLILREIGTRAAVELGRATT